MAGDMSIGGGGRFKALKASIEERNRKGPKDKASAAKRPGGGKIRDPGALAAFLGAKKFSCPKMQEMAAKGRRQG